MFFADSFFLTIRKCDLLDFFIFERFTVTLPLPFMRTNFSKSEIWFLFCFPFYGFICSNPSVEMRSSYIINGERCFFVFSIL